MNLLANSHFPGLCNTSIDNPGNTDKAKLVSSIIAFLETDTVLFYGEEPPELLKAQTEKWSPIILWFRDRFGVQVEPTTGFEVKVTASMLHLWSEDSCIHYFVFRLPKKGGKAFDVL